MQVYLEVGAQGCVFLTNVGDSNSMFDLTIAREKESSLYASWVSFGLHNTHILEFESSSMEC